MTNQNNIKAGERTHTDSGSVLRTAESVERATHGDRPHNDEETATLLVRVRRQPPSLANYFYHIEPGKKVYVTYRYPNDRVQVSTLESKYRCSEDYFTVSATSLQFNE